jgi:hypothetical protein
VVSEWIQMHQYAQVMGRGLLQELPKVRDAGGWGIGGRRIDLQEAGKLVGRRVSQR